MKTRKNTIPMMNRKLTNLLSCAAIFAAASFIAGHSAQAAPIYWDGTAATWTTLSGWSTVAGADTPDPVAIPGSADDAIFNITTVNTNQVIGMGGANQEALSLAFNSTGTVAIGNTGGNRDLTIGGGGITMASGAGAVTIGNTNNGSNVFLRLAASQTWLNNSTAIFTSRNITTGIATGAVPVTLTMSAANTGSINN
jgi:hypothetical protein